MVAKYLFQFLFIILSPSYWYQISRVNSVLDKELNISNMIVKGEYK